MAVVYRANATPIATGAAGTTVAPTVPAGAQVGDLLLMVLGLGNATAQTFGMPTGWTFRGANTSVAGAVQIAVFTKVCTLADIGATAAITWQTSTGVNAVITAYSGVDAVSPLDPLIWGTSVVGGTSANYGTPNLQLDDMVVAIASGTGGSVSTVSAGSNDFASPQIRVNNSASSGILVGVTDSSVTSANTVTTARAGTTASVTGTMSANGNFVFGLVALRPAQTPRKRDGSGGLGGFSVPGPVTITIPATTQNGDLAILTTFSGAGIVTATPAGWTLIQGATGSSLLSAFYKRCTLADAGTTFTVAMNGTANFFYSIFTYTGVDATQPVEASAYSASGTVLPSVTTTKPNCLLIGAVAASNAVTAPGGMVAESQTDVNVFDESVSSAVATGTRTVPGPTDCITVALRPAQNVPILRGAQWANSTPIVTSLTVPAPVTQSGDLLLAVMEWESAVSAIGPPAGWSAIGTPTVQNGVTVQVFQKLAGASEPASYTWSWTGGSPSSGIVWAVGPSLVGGFPALDVSAVVGGASGSPYTMPSITTTKGTELVLRSVQMASGNWTFTPPVGLDEVINAYAVNPAGTEGANVGYYEVAPVAGATGTRAATSGFSRSPGMASLGVYAQPLNAGLAMVV